MAKEMSNYAAAAKQIRVWLKAQGIAARVNSEGYSMGSSVNVEIYDQAPEVRAKVEEFASQYQQGRFDGMQDLYEYSNVNKDLPQAKYVFVNNEISDAMRQEIWDFALGYYGGLEGAPAEAKAAYNFRIVDWGIYGDQMIYRLFQGGFNQNEFWEFKAKQQKIAA